MTENGLYFLKPGLFEIIRSVGGEWNDVKQRPMVCLVPVSEDSRLYWAIPMGNMKHRSADQIARLNRFIGLPERDIRSCFYHIGRTTVTSIFFISDCIPVTDAFLDKPYDGYDGTPFVIKNPKLIAELRRKLYRILAFENSRPNYFRQHITDTKNYLLNEVLL